MKFKEKKWRRSQTDSGGLESGRFNVVASHQLMEVRPIASG